MVRIFWLGSVFWLFCPPLIIGCSGCQTEPCKTIINQIVHILLCQLSCIEYNVFHTFLVDLLYDDCEPCLCS